MVNEGIGTNNNNTKIIFTCEKSTVGLVELLVKMYSRIGGTTVTVVFVKWPSRPGPVCILLDESTAAGSRGRWRCAPMGGGRAAPCTGRPWFPTPSPRVGLARSTATFRRSRGITLYGHKTNSTTRLVETRHKPATAAERIPISKIQTANGISSRRRRPAETRTTLRPVTILASLRYRRRRCKWRVV